MNKVGFWIRALPSLLLGPRLFGQTSEYWLGAPPTANYGTVSNWSKTLGGTGNGSVPSASTLAAVFGASTVTSLTLPASAFSVANFTFNSGAPAYAFSESAGTFQFEGAGVVNNSSNAATFNVVAGGDYVFDKTSSSGNSIFNLNGGGGVVFIGKSGNTAGTSTFNLTGTSEVDFQGSSSAGSAHFNVSDTSTVSFSVTANAGSGTFNIGSGSRLVFYNGTASAGTSTTFPRLATAPPSVRWRAMVESIWAIKRSRSEP